MKKNTYPFLFGLILIAGLLSTRLLWAADEKGTILKKPKKPKVNHTFVVETDERTAAQSLDRISGQIDPGFLSPRNVFKSPDHYRAGPFSREKTEAEKNSAPSV